MCRITCATVAALFVAQLTLFADKPLNGTDRVLRASCRVFAGNARGSGVIFDADEDNYHVLTNAHVVGTTSLCVVNKVSPKGVTLDIPTNHEEVASCVGYPNMTSLVG